MTPPPRSTDLTPDSNVLYAKSTPGGRDTLWAALLACLVLLPLLGHRPLADWDEGIYAEISREMLATHSFLVPHWNGHLWFEKPPLAMWLTAASLRLFGLNAFAARLPSALAGIATVALLHTWLRNRLGQLTAWLGTVILLSAFGFQHAARAGETDSLLTLWCLLSILGLSAVTEENPKGWLLFWTGLALALMTKSAAAIVLPITALLLSVLEPRRLLHFPKTFLLGLTIFLAIVLPWHAWMLLHFGQPFLQDYLGFHVLHRATGAIEGHLTHPWFFLWVLLLSAPPFVLLFPFALVAPFRKPELRSLRAQAVFALVVLVFYSAVRTRLPHYIAPAYPVLSALAASVLGLWLQQHAPQRRTRASLAAAAVVVYLATAALTAHARSALHSPRLPNGLITPDNRETANILQQAANTIQAVPGALLVLHQRPVVPITTAAFYSRHLVQQVTLDQPAAGQQQDPYTFAPEPILTAAARGDRLILLDCSLLPALPAPFTLQPIVTGRTQVLGLLQRGGVPTSNQICSPKADFREK